MSAVLHRLSRVTLEQLAAAFSSGRIQPPYHGFSLRECVTAGDAGEVGVALEGLRAQGLNGPQIGIVLRLLANERAMQQIQEDRLQMVWSGPDQHGPASRDTGAVVRELLSQAKTSLLITTYSISRGETIF